MKKSNTCPKCGSHEILRVDDGTNGLLLGFLSTVLVSRYVCCDCGYVEEWVDDQIDLKILKEKLEIQRKKEN